MSLYLSITDFTGASTVPTDKYTNVNLQSYIDKYELIYLKHLLGATLYDEFATDFAIIGTRPTEQRFVDIWDDFSQDNNSLLVISEGIKQMLVKFIYFEFMRDLNVQKNIGGITTNEQANSLIAAFASSNIISIYNQGIDSYISIQWFINKDLTIYEGFNGVKKYYTIG